MRRIVYWNKHLPTAQRKTLYARLGIKGGMSVNGESIAETDDTDFLAELEHRNILRVRKK